MLIPHFHFDGNCNEAVALYEKAFNTKAGKAEYFPSDVDGQKRIAHIRMKIHNQTVFLNDRFGNKYKSLDCAVHMILTFKTANELLACYEVLDDGGKVIDPLKKTPYTELAGNLMDKFGVLWGFMVSK